MRFINTAQEIPAGEICIYGAGVEHPLVFDPSPVRTLAGRITTLDVGTRGVGRTASPVNMATIPRCADHMGQLVTSDAYYFRDPLAAPVADAPPLERLLRLVVLAEAAHQQEYAFEVLGWAAGVPAYAEHAAALREIFNAAAADYAALAEPKENA